MKSALRKWGNSAAVRIPVAVLEAARLTLDTNVEVRAEGDRIVIEPMRSSSFRLEALLKQINPDNLHQDIDFGRAGREVW